MKSKLNAELYFCSIVLFSFSCLDSAVFLFILSEIVCWVNSGLLYLYIHYINLPLYTLNVHLGFNKDLSSLVSQNSAPCVLG